MPLSEPTHGRPRAAPVWLLALAGAIGARAALEHGRRLDAARAAQASGLAARVEAGARPLGLATASARELRRVPGVGRKLALEIVRLREARGGPPEDLTEVRGIGPVLARRVAEWLARR